jgi:hypothetical protein
MAFLLITLDAKRNLFKFCINCRVGIRKMPINGKEIEVQSKDSNETSNYVYRNLFYHVYGSRE